MTTPTLPKTLLDTDIFSEVLKAKDPNVVARASVYHAYFGHYTIASVTVMEVVKGLHKLQQPDRLSQFLSRLGSVEVLGLDTATADLAGRIYADLERTGQTIGRADRSSLLLPFKIIWFWRQETSVTTSAYRRSATPSSWTTGASEDVGVSPALRGPGGERTIQCLKRQTPRLFERRGFCSVTDSSNIRSRSCTSPIVCGLTAPIRRSRRSWLTERMASQSMTLGRVNPPSGGRERKA